MRQINRLILIGAITGVLFTGCATTEKVKVKSEKAKASEGAAKTEDNIIRIDGKPYRVLTIKDEVKPEDIEYDVEVQFEEGVSKDGIAEIIKKYQGEIIYTIPERRLYMVKFSDGETADKKQGELEKEKAVQYFGINPFKGIAVIYAEKRLRVKFKSEVSEEKIKETVKKYGVEIAVKNEKGVYELEIIKNQTVTETVNLFRKDDNVISADPEYLGELQNKPNDRYFTDQWYLEQPSNIDIDIEQAWGLMESTRMVKVAVVDSGVDYKHSEIKRALIQTTGSEDIYGHGTNIAGIIGAETNNGEGISGICWNGKKMVVKVIPIKVTNGRYIKLEDMIEGLDAVIKEKPEVINLSVVLDNSDRLKAVIDKAMEKGITIIASAGNDGIEINENNKKFHRVFPGAYGGVINVGAYNREGKRWKDSNYGEGIEIYAPGEDIYTTGLNNTYNSTDGTSMSAAIVTGIVALMKSEKPNLTTEQIRTILKETSKNGMVNAYQAIKRVQNMKGNKETELSQQSQETDEDIYIPTVIAQGKWGDGEGEFGYMETEVVPIAPRAITVSDKVIYILDPENGRVVKYKTDGEYLGVVELEKIKELEVRGKKWKIDKDASKIEIAPGVYIGGEADFLEVDYKGNLYLKASDGWGIQRVIIYNSFGKFIIEWSEEKTGEGVYRLLINDNGEVFFTQVYKRNSYGKLIELSNEQRNFFKISPPKKIMKVHLKEIQPKIKILWKKEEMPKISPKAKLNRIADKLIEVHNKKPWLGKTIKLLISGEIYQIVYDDENVDLGWKIIKWEKQKKVKVQDKNKIDWAWKFEFPEKMEDMIIEKKKTKTKILKNGKEIIIEKVVKYPKAIIREDGLKFYDENGNNKKTVDFKNISQPGWRSRAKVSGKYIGVSSKIGGYDKEGNRRASAGNFVMIDSEGNILWKFKKHLDYFHPSPDGKYVVGVPNGEWSESPLYIYNSKGIVIKEIQKPNDGYKIDFSKNGELIALGLNDTRTRRGYLTLLDKNGNEKWRKEITEREKEIDGFGINNVAISNNGEYILVVTIKAQIEETGEIKVIKGRTGREKVLKKRKYIGTQYHLDRFNKSGKLIWRKEISPSNYKFMFSEDDSRIIVNDINGCREFQLEGKTGKEIE
ncbi:MAG: hypothetical protein CVU78_04830 [Elusimicrobia bacterium HGW-Elusimicrobia-2]|nr:MAG: hypothetical protein CVU78_04830 [Elusimicrobia bacterium HGW-Elusimicrobia-2]